MKQALRIDKLNYKGLETRIKIVGSISSAIKDQLKQHKPNLNTLRKKITPTPFCYL